MRHGSHLGAPVVGLAGFLVGNWPGAVMAVTLWCFMPRLAERRRRERERRRLGAELATVLELAARGVRTGMAPEAALLHASELTGGLAADLIGELVRWLGAGDPGGAVRRWTHAHDDPAVAVVAATVDLVTGREGGSARGFEAAATVLRARDRRARDAESWAAQSRSSATLLVAAPVVLAAGSFVLDPSIVARVMFEPAAIVCVTFGVGLDLLGAWWMRRLLTDVSGFRR